jgi:DNA-binding response OmpR family regulator
MYVLTATSARAAELHTACDPLGIEVAVAPHGGAQLAADLLAVFYDVDGDEPLPLAAVREHGAYAVLLVPEPVHGGTVLDAIRAGYSFVLTQPVRTDRVRALLDYLATVASPRPSRELTLDRDDMLCTPSRSVALSAAESAVLHVFANHPDRIVARQRLALASGDTPLRETLSRLRTHLDAIGSGAQVLNVPHIGYRLAGHVVLAQPRDTTN